MKLITITAANGYSGLISEFVDGYVVPNLPRPDAVLAWTESLLAYYDRPGATFIVRGPVGRRGAPFDVGGVRSVEGDNSPGWWCYLRASDGVVTADDLDRALADGEVAILYAAKRTERAGWVYGQAMSNADKAAFSVPRLKHCHIESALDGAPPDARVRALRNLCPINRFLFPMPTKFTMSRFPMPFHSNRFAADFEADDEGFYWKSIAAVASHATKVTGRSAALGRLRTSVRGRRGCTGRR